MQIRLNVGEHIQNEVRIVGEDKDGNPITQTYEQKYKALPGRPGPVFETDVDLAKRWPEKFERITADEDNIPELEARLTKARELKRIKDAQARQGSQTTPVASAARQGFNQGNTAAPPRPAPLSEPPSPPMTTGEGDTFNDMTKDELIAWAASEEVDLGAAKTKDQILAACRAAQARMAGV